MGNALVPYILRDDKVLTPQMINANFHRLLEQQKQAMGRRYVFDEILVEFKPGADQATAQAQLELTLNLRSPCTVVGRELFVYGTSAAVFDLSVAGMSDLSVTGGGATTLVVGRDLERKRISGYTTIQLDSETATWTADRVWCVLHVAYDRHEANPPTATLSDVLDSDTLDAAATKVNANTTALAAYNTSLASNEEIQRVDVIMYDDVDFSSISTVARDFLIPADGGTLRRIELHVVADNTATITAELFDEAASSVDAIAVTGTSSTAANQDNTEFTETQTDADCQASGDYSLRFSYSGSGTVYTVYAQLYWA